MSPLGYVPRPYGRIRRIFPRDVWAFRFAHTLHRGETGVCRHGGKVGQDGTVHAEARFDIG